MKKFLSMSLFLVLASCTTPKEETTLPPVEKKTSESVAKVKPCLCIKMYMPVCGEDKKTYGNSCEADCAGVKYVMGACQEKNETE